ncbi:MAG: Outer membrane protein assembly factor BamD [Verrucomicrobiae bacterium]|nr:Outer membrane protein assembly factor BamD [Verrucomicrobiae bacterium]
MKPYLLLLLLATGVHAQSSNEFVALVERVQKTPGAATTAEVTKLLQLSQELNRPYTAATAVKAYFTQNLNVPAPLLKAAAENAALAGDFRTAVTRYKQYLRLVPGNAESSVIAARLYQLQVDFLGATDDAYRFMDEFGDSLRQSVAARRYDQWFLNTARARRQHVAVARRLGLILADQLPVELERLVYWESLEWLMTELATPTPELYPALPHLQRLPALIRNSPRIQTRLQFLVTNLATRSTPGDLTPLVTAARAYLDAAPNSDTLRDIVLCLANSRYENPTLTQILNVRGEIFLYAFGKFTDAERETFLNRSDLMTSLATPAQWTALAAKHPAIFRKSPGALKIPFTPAPAEVLPESWRLSFTEIAAQIRAVPAADAVKLMQTPLPLFSVEAARDYITTTAAKTDKTQLPALLRTLDWVPYTLEQRRTVFTSAQNEFKQWAADPKNKEQAAVITAVDAAFKQALDPATGDPAKAPNPLCQHLAKAVVATRAKDTPGFLAAARAAYALLRDYDIKKTPSGSAALAYLLQSRPDAFDFQAEILADQLTRYEPQAANRPLQETVTALMANRARYTQLSGVFAKALLDQLAKKQFHSEIFHWFRLSRRLESGLNQNLHPEVLAKMIDQKVLLQSAYRPDHRSATATYQYLIRNEFNALAKNYSVLTAFDEMFAAEVRATRFVDPAFWLYSTDEKRLAANATAEVLGDYEKYPFGYESEKEVYTRTAFFDIHNRALLADPPVRAALFAKLATYAGKTRFDYYANGGAWMATQADASTEAGRKEFFDRFNAFTTLAASLPITFGRPGLTQLVRLTPAKLTAAEFETGLRLIQNANVIPWAPGAGHDRLGILIFEALRAENRDAELFAILPHLWRIQRDTGDANLARALLEPGLAADLAAVNATVGLDLLGATAHESLRNALAAMRSRALANIGTIIPVERSDRRYPLFAAQAAYLGGKLDNAWQLASTSADLISSTFRELDPNFTIWIVEKQTDLGNFDDAESLARTLLQWVDSAPTNFDPEVRARLYVAFASIAFARQEFPRARAQFEQIATAKEYADTDARREAELKIAEVDRLTKHYDKATDLLEKLARRKDPYLQAQANYQLALVKFDQEQFPEARQALEQVFALEPTHPNARILEGKLYLKLKKLVEATEVRVGLAANQQTIVPGRPLKIQLEDRNLAIAGKSANIEIRVWADSGDEEIFNLLPFGDSKTKFEGTLSTTLGAPKKGDRLLQVLGADVVRYDYSDKFKQLHKITAGDPANISVISDAELAISSGKILSKAEQEERALEAQIRARVAVDDTAESSVALSTIRADNEIKPGAAINVRVTDLDQSTTGGKNTLTIRAATTSGDRVDAFVLAETAPYTGVFEGKLPTASAPATAYASDSEEGREPNFVIAKGDHPAWVGLADNNRPKIFNVDLNNNVPLGQLVIQADVPGRKLKNFLLQTSLNGRDFNNVAAWPTALPIWDGAPRWEVAPLASGRPLPLTVEQCRDYLDVGYLAAGASKALQPGTEKLKTPGTAWHIARFSGIVELAERQLHTFRVDHKNQLKNVHYLLVVDGQTETRSPHEITRSLSKGQHRLDLYVRVLKNAPMEFELLMDDNPIVFAPKATGLPQPAVVTATNTGFTVAFAPDSRARVLRLWLVDFETDAPAIKRLTLTDATGLTVLPAAADVINARKNQILEVVPGDRVTITYEDPRVITKERQVLTESLRATYHNATLSACFIESRVDANGNRRPEYIPLRRFKPGDAVNIFIKDADGDISDAQDKVKFWARVGDGQRINLEALETELHSGVFIGKVFPVAGAPQRPAELTVRSGDDVLIGYLDEENTDPGVPWDRTVVVEQTVETTPVLKVYDMVSRPLTEDELKVAARAAEGKHLEEFIPVTRTVAAVWSNQAASALVGTPLLVDLVYPTIAQSFKSTATILVQAGKPQPFDPTLPATITLTRAVGDAGRLAPPPGYREVQVRGNPRARDPLEDGRFQFMIPIKLGQTSLKEDDFVSVSVRGPAVDTQGETRWVEGESKVPALGVRPGDEIRVAFQVGTNWITQHVAVKADALFDVMERRYQQPVSSLHVGESLYFRVIDPLGDTTDEKDQLEIKLVASSGPSTTLKLTETFSHSGTFKGRADVVFAGDAAKSNATDVVRVNYGDTIRAIYRAGEVERTVQVFKGATGSVLPFTKRFKDPEIAVQTQFTIAEAYFEMAKKHRELGQEELSRQEIAQGKKLLEEVIRDYPNTEARAQADYLLADLAYEGATDAATEEAKKKAYMEAVVRFSDIVATYPDSAYAPKAQFKKALIFEKTGQVDQACEEYVKLSYRYPDNELVAETIARLGQYFLTKGREIQDKAAAEASVVEKEKALMQARDMFKTAAQVFSRLAVRFPDHKLSGKTTVLAAQCYMRAEDLPKAIEVFKRVIEEKKAEPDLIAQSMFWCGECYMKLRQPDYVNAYRMYKKLTWDYPESKWAKSARGRLTEDALVQVEQNDQAGTN